MLKQVQHDNTIDSEKNIPMSKEPNTIIAITTFPNPGSGIYGPRAHFSAICWHSERILAEVAKKAQVIVCADILPESMREFSSGKRLAVKRIWRQKNPLSLLRIIPFVLAYPQAKFIYIPFEFSVFGGILSNIILLFVLLIMRVLGKKIIFEMHQVVFDISPLEKHIGKKDELYKKIIGFGLPIYYRLIGTLVSEVIVFESALRHRLKRYICESKISIFSIPVDDKAKKSNTPSQKIAKKALGYEKKDFVMLLFGYINGYKGIDFAINAMRYIRDPHVKLLIAGGPNPHQAGKNGYDEFFESVRSLTKRDDRIRITGFVQDDEVAKYFVASDLVIFPYTVFMSASGPFSLCLTYGKPFILSQALWGYIKSHDLAKTLSIHNLKTEDVFFPLTHKQFAKRIEDMANGTLHLNKLTQVSIDLANERSITNHMRNLQRLFGFEASPNKNIIFNSKISYHKLIALFTNKT
jgi:glycosyltransferase involved in cell wall biosynthesis